MTKKYLESLSDAQLRAVVVELCERMKRVEERMGLDSPAARVELAVESGAAEAGVSKELAKAPESLEFELGQNWFALIGIVVLAIGIGFVLSLPFEGLPAVVPPIGGVVLAGGVFLLARISQRSFEAIGKYLWGAGMLLLFYSVLRLFYFGNPSALGPESLVGRGLFLAVVAFNLWLAWRRASPKLFIVALITGFAVGVAIGSTVFLLGLASLMVISATIAQVRREWRMLAPVGIGLGLATYTIWAMGNPLLGHDIQIQDSAYGAVYLLLCWILVFTVAVMMRLDREREDTPVQVTGVLLCGPGFAVFFLHNLFAFDRTFIASHLAAFVLFLSLALVFWKREKSWFSTFIYAMTGYMALSFGLIKAFGIPEVFVALSLQSLVVIATAIYFRSRFIIVANCLIFIGILIGYKALTDVEQGMSIGFGVVALISARVLNLNKDKLELKTELMRNIYLGIAFMVFPYALYYLLPEAYVVVSWVGLALFYYGMNALLRIRKYRWMGHMTLLLSALYVVVVGTSRLDPSYRIISFLVLGSIMLIVSLVFTISRARRSGNEPTNTEPEGDRTE